MYSQNMIVEVGTYITLRTATAEEVVKYGNGDVFESDGRTVFVSSDAWTGAK